MLWIGYGTNDLGRIDLARTRAQLRLDVSPKPQRLELAGAYTVYNLTNASGLTGFGPGWNLCGSGMARRIPASLRGGSGRQRGKAGIASSCPWERSNCGPILPRGRYRLLSILHRDVELAGQAPARIDDLPEGPYRLRAWRGDYARETNLTVRAGGTNAVLLTFEYGELRLNTTPQRGGGDPGVQSSPGAAPPPRLACSSPASIGFASSSQGIFRWTSKPPSEARGWRRCATNLTSYRYAEAMAAAQREATRTNYARALDQVAIALEESPGDPGMASALKQQLAPLLQQERRQEAERQRVPSGGRALEAPRGNSSSAKPSIGATAELFETQTLRVRASLKQVHAGLLRALAAAPAVGRAPEFRVRRGHRADRSARH